MKPRFGFIILHGDGSRVIRVSVPRWLVHAAVSACALGAATMMVLSGGYLRSRSQAGELVELRSKVSRQQAAFGSYVHRVAAVRDEIDSWKELHARMWRPFGPENLPPETAAGIGGPSQAGTGAEAGSADDPLAPGSEPSGSLGEQLDLLNASISEEGPRLKDLEAMMSRNARIMAALPLRWPAKGPVNSEFGLRRNPWGTGAREHHGGIDIGVPYAEPIKAPSRGVVVLAGPHGEYGNTILLDHGHQVRSLYGHLSKVLVRSGQHVEKGEVLGLAGSTGRSTGTHLHYEVRVQGRPVNPRSFIWD